MQLHTDGSGHCRVYRRGCATLFLSPTIKFLWKEPRLVKRGKQTFQLALASRALLPDGFAPVLRTRALCACCVPPATVSFIINPLPLELSARSCAITRNYNSVSFNLTSRKYVVDDYDFLTNSTGLFSTIETRHTSSVGKNLLVLRTYSSISSRLFVVVAWRISSIHLDRMANIWERILQEQIVTSERNVKKASKYTKIFLNRLKIEIPFPRSSFSLETKHRSNKNPPTYSPPRISLLRFIHEFPNISTNVENRPRLPLILFLRNPSSVDDRVETTRLATRLDATRRDARKTKCGRGI